MRVLIFEPDFGGHRLHYVRNLILALREMAQEPTVAMAVEAPATPEFAAHLADIRDSCQIDAWMPRLPASVMQVGMQRARMLRQCIDRSRPDWIYVPCADVIGQVLGLRRTARLPSLPRDIPAEGLMLRGGFAYPHASRRRSIFYRIAWAAACRAPWRVMHVLDPIAYEPTIRNGGTVARRCQLMPDPVEVHDTFDRTVARARLQIPADGQYIGCAGIMDRRKGIDLLIRAFAEVERQTPVRLLLAGQQEPAIVEMLRGPFAELVRKQRIISLDRTFPVAGLLDALTAMDLVCALYPEHIGSASIAIRAAAARRPVLAHTWGWVGTMVPRFNLGWTCNALDHDVLTQSLRQALEAAPTFKLTPAGERFVEFHRVENFQACWTAELRRHLGMEPAPGHRPWEWVLEAV